MGGCCCLRCRSLGEESPPLAAALLLDSVSASAFPLPCCFSTNSSWNQKHRKDGGCFGWNDSPVNAHLPPLQCLPIFVLLQTRCAMLAPSWQNEELPRNLPAGISVLTCPDTAGPRLYSYREKFLLAFLLSLVAAHDKNLLAFLSFHYSFLYVLLLRHMTRTWSSPRIIHKRLFHHEMNEPIDCIKPPLPQPPYGTDEELWSPPSANNQLAVLITQLNVLQEKEHILLRGERKEFFRTPLPRQKHSQIFPFFCMIRIFIRRTCNEKADMAFISETTGI